MTVSTTDLLNAVWQNSHVTYEYEKLLTCLHHWSRSVWNKHWSRLNSPFILLFPMTLYYHSLSEYLHYRDKTGLYMCQIWKLSYCPSQCICVCECQFRITSILHTQIQYISQWKWLCYALRSLERYYVCWKSHSNSDNLYEMEIRREYYHYCPLSLAWRILQKADRSVCGSEGRERMTQAQLVFE